jgi:hypothetical protein
MWPALECTSERCLKGLLDDVKVAVAEGAQEAGAEFPILGAKHRFDSRAGLDHRCRIPERVETGEGPIA